MANISSLQRVALASAALVTTVLPLTACGSTPSQTIALPPPVNYCVGPERVDDIGDLLHREMVVYPEAYCAGALSQGFSIVSAADYASMPDVGETVYVDPTWGYARGPVRVFHSTHVVHVVNPPVPPRSSVLIVRDPTVGSSQVRAAAATRAQTARKAGVSGVPAGTTAGPSGSSTVTRGGLGSTTASAGSVRQVDAGAISKASAGKSQSTTKGSMSGGMKSSPSPSASSSRSSSKTGR